MQIWVDADACPVVIKEILYKTAIRCSIEVTLVANQFLQIPSSRYLRAIQVGAGFDVADNEIITRMASQDLVVTSDIPLAAEVIEKDGIALSPRGELYTKENIRASLNMRDFMDSLRGSGIETGGPPSFTKSDRKAFADQLDRYLNRPSS
ncbi:MAG: DUF188 domain-containing protein [Acidiferrobacteraceae bacterium]|nr:DUF188 domain-containing protein [Acidiferrobacteraceae bacterium]MDP6435379.1 YaiI/YqxD family protein [Arenicellales bacterium]MDP6672509.1 YaiI/YqxD family protein [Arenicellales bacterium]MDP6723624.1 YaiI/YqxD family protein [Arenicellales bacterium]